MPPLVGRFSLPVCGRRGRGVNHYPSLVNHILHTLSKNGFTKTLRGPLGGHSLAMEPADIKLSMVMAAFDETGTIIGCLENTATCKLSDSCGQRNIWQTVDEAVNEILERTTIADLLRPSMPLAVDSPQKSIRES